MAPNAPNGEAAVDEITPLLATSSQDPPLIANGVSIINHEQRHETAEEDETPLPMGQIFILCIARLMDPISFFSIFPFVPSMVASTGVSEVDVGFYTGLIESIFSIVQMLTMIFWGRLSDTYGRKPILVLSMSGLAATVTLFGASKTIWQMIMFRAMGGLFSGSVVTIRAMFSEISTPKTQARAFSWFAFAGNIGIFTGPLIGGLAKPAEQYPAVFGNVQFFKDFPYLLPTLVSGGIATIATVIVALFVKETLKIEGEPSANGTRVTKAPPMTTLEILKHPGVPVTLAIFSYSALMGFSYTAMVPVFWFTPIKYGGYGFPPKLISLFLSISGSSQALWLLLVFPPLQKRIGTGGVLRLCTNAWPITFGLAPLGNVFLRKGWKAAFWSVAPVGQGVGSGVAMAFTAVQLAINDISPSPQTLGTLNGIALTCQSAVRAITPWAASSIYARGVSQQILWGQLGWAVLIALALGFAVLARWLPEKAGGKPTAKRTEHDDET